MDTRGGSTFPHSSCRYDDIYTLMSTPYHHLHESVVSVRVDDTGVHEDKTGGSAYGGHGELQISLRSHCVSVLPSTSSSSWLKTEGLRRSPRRHCITTHREIYAHTTLEFKAMCTTYFDMLSQWHWHVASFYFAYVVLV